VKFEYFDRGPTMYKSIYLVDKWVKLEVLQLSVHRGQWTIHHTAFSECLTKAGKVAANNFATPHVNELNVLKRITERLEG